MHKELKELYPDLYTNVRSGFFVDHGWEQILKDLSEILQGFVTDMGVEIQVNQVKEKFGSLSFYYSVKNTDAQPKWVLSAIHSAVRYAEIQSTHTCDVCGERGQIRNIGGWWTTKCDDHYQKESNAAS